jgi:hypothetical protein
MLFEVGYQEVIKWVYVAYFWKASNLRLKNILLHRAAVANIMVETMNSPEIKPRIPVKNIRPIIISFLKSVSLKPLM